MHSAAPNPAAANDLRDRIFAAKSSQKCGTDLAALLLLDGCGSALLGGGLGGLLLIAVLLVAVLIIVRLCLGSSLEAQGHMER
jgi:hypothetical protein